METVAKRSLAPALKERLQRLGTLERTIAARLEVLLAGDPPEGVDAEPLAAALGLASSHRAALDDLASRRDAHMDHEPPGIGTSTGDTGSVARRIEDLEGLVTQAVAGYGALYATGRLLYETEIADEIAAPFGEAWRDAAVQLGDAVVVAVHAELVAGGFTCRCVCPACGMGACLCTRNSLDTIRELWRRPATESGDGIELRIAPRAGSEMERVGMAKGDRILAVDGQSVRTNAELQRALRAHPIGEAIAIEVERGGRHEEIRAARVSDLP